MSLHNLGIGSTNSLMGVELVGTNLHIFYKGLRNNDNHLYHAAINAFSFQIIHKPHAVNNISVKPGVDMYIYKGMWAAAYAESESGKIMFYNQNGSTTSTEKSHYSKYAPSVCSMGEDIFIAYADGNSIKVLSYNRNTTQWETLCEANSTTVPNFPDDPCEYPVIFPFKTRVS